MAIKAGDRMPAGTFKTKTKDGIQDVTTDQLFKGKTVVLFSVPGAFTPDLRCQAPAGLRREGVGDQGEGRRHHRLHGGERRVRDGCLGQARRTSATTCSMLADGNGDYAKALGLEMDGRGFGMGTRGQRFAIVVKDGVATDVEIEAPKEFKVRAADYILAKL